MVFALKVSNAVRVLLLLSNLEGVNAGLQDSFKALGTKFGNSEKAKEWRKKFEDEKKERFGKAGEKFKTELPSGMDLAAFKGKTADEQKAILKGIVEKKKAEKYENMPDFKGSSAFSELAENPTPQQKMAAFQKYKDEKAVEKWEAANSVSLPDGWSGKTPEQKLELVGKKKRAEWGKSAAEKTKKVALTKRLAYLGKIDDSFDGKTEEEQNKILETEAAALVAEHQLTAETDQDDAFELASPLEQYALLSGDIEAANPLPAAANAVAKSATQKPESLFSRSGVGLFLCFLL